MRRRDFLAGSALGAAGLLTARPAFPQEASNTAKQAFSFGYPLVLMDLTHRAMAGSAGPDQPAPFNRFFHYPQPANSQFTSLVCPVPDALHTSAWLNVKDEPVVISVPAAAGRFWTGSFFHAWYDVIGRMGSSQNGGKATYYVVTGPGWSGTVPKGLVQITSPTNLVWAPVWIASLDASDLAPAQALQAQFEATPLKDWKGPKQSPGAGGGGSLAGLIGSFFKSAPNPFGGRPAPPPGMAPPMAATAEAMPAATPEAAAAASSGSAAAPAPMEGSVGAAGGGSLPGAAAAAPPAAVSPDGLAPAPGTEGGAAMPAGSAAAGGGQMPSSEGLSEGGPGAGGGGGANGASPNSVLFTMDAPTFYTRLCQLMSENAPLAADAAIVGKMAKLGMTPGATVDVMGQSRANQIAILGGTRNAGQKIFMSKGGLKVVTANRWETAVGIQDFGTNYDRRAHAALMHFGASSSEDVLCPRTSKDAAGKPLTSATKYHLTFAAGQLPPVSQSWSLVAYRAPFMELVDPPNGKVVINSKSPLVPGPDGSITIYIQKDNPGGEKEANWLAAPEGQFELLLRLCGPKPEVAALQWKPPAVTKA